MRFVLTSIYLKRITWFLLTAMIVSCKQAPTKVIEESSDIFSDRTVLVDTRSAFKYASYHIEGSVNLETASFLVIKTAKKNERAMDTDLEQIIERLARRGIAPGKSIILLSDKADDVENKKWTWLLNRLEVENVQRVSIEEFKKQLSDKKRIDRFSTPKPVDPWNLRISPALQNELILKKSQDCFVNWSSMKCS